jgi:hypothetical protein
MVQRYKPLGPEVQHKLRWGKFQLARRRRIKSDNNGKKACYD